MNAEQFQQLITTLQQQSQQQITALVQQLQTSNSLAKIPLFENFDGKQEKFTNYMERFENYATMKGVTEDEQKSQLLQSSVGLTHYNSLTAFLGPSKPIKDLSYTDLVKNLKQMLVPLRSTLVSQHYFLNVSQREDQSVAEFVASLQKDMVECEFIIKHKCSCQKEEEISCSELFLRAQFIRGLRDNWLREQLLQSTITEFDKLITKAIALEASKIESKELGKTTSVNPSTPTAVTPNIAPLNQVLGRGKASYHQSRRNQGQQNRSQSRNRRNRSQSHHSRRVDFKKLGIDGLCLHCARDNHRTKECRIPREKLYCKACQHQGHVQRVCITTLTKKQQKPDDTSSTKNVNEDYTFSLVNSIVDLHYTNLDEEEEPDEKYYVTIGVSGKPLTMEVDSGARFSIIAEDVLTKAGIHARILPSRLAFKSYSKDIIPTKGKIHVTAAYDGKEIRGTLFIVPAGHDTILGRTWIRKLQIDLQAIDRLQQKNQQQAPTLNVTEMPSLNTLLQKYSSICERKVGCVPNVIIKHQIRENEKPIYVRERPLPYALRKPTEEALQQWEKWGIIEPCGTSDWGSPLVIIPRADGRIRPCIDYKCTLNDKLVASNFPQKKFREIATNLKNSSHFCKIDLFEAYLHFLVDEESALLQTITTHKGPYRMKRLGYGIKTAPAEFNRAMQKILQNLPGVEFYFDDILVHGESYLKCYENLDKCLQRLKENDLHLNLQKCQFFKSGVEYLGYHISKNTVKKQPQKIAAMTEFPRPKNAAEISRFLGLITYYSAFIPNLSSRTAPLRRLLQKGIAFKWTPSCEAAFIDLKSEIASERVLTIYNPDAPLIVTTDASPVGVAAILSHQVEGQEKPIAYASRSLTVAEQNYSQIDREALAIVFAFNYFYQYLYGRSFTLVTDNQALTHIFSPKKAIPKITSARLLRYASFLSTFDYKICYKKGEENTNADCLSRAPIEVSLLRETQIHDEVADLYHEAIFRISTEKINARIIAEETQKDSELRSLYSDLQLGKNMDESYSIMQGVIFKNNRVVIPTSLQSLVLSELHYTHLGITKMKQLARNYVYWYRIDKDIEKLVKGCAECALTQKNPPHAPIHPWETPDQNWQRIHIDYAGPYQEKYYFLIVVDALSKWAEVATIRQAPSSESTIEILTDIFSRHGYPELIVSDNASIFKSEEFSTYCEDRAIRQRFIAPNYPQTNGLAERNVQTLKSKLKAMGEEDLPMKKKIQAILQKYRATPLASGKSPAELYLGRRLRLRLDAIFPQKSLPYKVPEAITSKHRKLNEGDRVTARVLRNNVSKWEFGTIIKVLGTRFYIVQLDHGYTFKCHIDQLRGTLSPKKSVSFATPTTAAPTVTPFGVPNGPSPPPQPPVPLPQPVHVNPPPPVAPIRRSNRNIRPPRWQADYCK